MGKIIVIIVAIIFLLSFIIPVLLLVIGYFDWGPDKTAPKISFNDFLHFYQAAPEKWKLWDDRVFYLKEKIYMSGGDYLFTLPVEKEIAFRTFHDFKLYVKWKKEFDKKEVEKKRRQNTVEFIEDVKKDVDERKRREGLK